MMPFWLHNIHLILDFNLGMFHVHNLHSVIIIYPNLLETHLAKWFILNLHATVAISPMSGLIMNLTYNVNAVHLEFNCCQYGDFVPLLSMTIL